MRFSPVRFVELLVARLRELEPTVKITFEDGWQARGTGQVPDWKGMIGHHTGTPSTAKNPFPTKRMLVTGRSDLSGPLCNSSTPWSSDVPWVHIVAAGVANHAGASAKNGKVGKSLGPLPATATFNRLVWGNESDYSGMEQPPAGTLYAMLLVARAVCDVLVLDITHARFHFETSVTGKWDAGIGPGVSINGGLFRARAAVIMFVPPVPVLPPPIEDDMFDADDKARLATLATNATRAYFYMRAVDGSAWETNGIEQWHVPDEQTLTERIYVLTAMGITPVMYVEGKFLPFGSSNALFGAPRVKNPAVFGREI